MKKVYMPTTDELYLMQDMGINLYKYILVKAIESLVMDVKVYKNKDESILKSAYKYLRENPDIIFSICQMYPEEIVFSEYAQNDPSLCNKLITSTQDNSIYSLDNLSYFEKGLGVLDNTRTTTTTAQILAKKLPDTPKYRFEYKQNSLLDNIFACEIPAHNISGHVVEDFLIIEPAYAVKLSDSKLANVITMNANKAYILNCIMNEYAKRYGINLEVGKEYNKKDILTNPDTEVKRLLKCINQRQIKK